MPCTGSFADAYDFASFWCIAGLDTGVDDSGLTGQAFLTDTTADFAFACDKFVRNLFSQSMPDDLVDPVVSKMCDAPPEIAIASMRDIPDYDLAAALSDVDLPIRCLNSQKYPTNLEVNRKYAKDYDVKTLMGSGHFPMFEVPDAFKLVLVKEVDVLSGRASE